MKHLLVLIALLGSLMNAASAQTHSLVYSFSGGTTDGTHPYGPVIQAPDGNLYGMTPAGGLYNGGVIYRLTPDGKETVLYSFALDSSTTGPFGGLTLASDGKLYGFTPGGTYGAGQFFSLTLSGTFSSLYNFTGTTDGGSPQGSPVEGSDGRFYGAAAVGGLGYGTVFAISPSGAFTLLHQLNGVQDSGDPQGGLIEGSDGYFYGLSNNSDTGATFTVGAVYRVAADGTFTTIYNFFGTTDGGNPAGELVEGPDGAYYGTTRNYGLSVGDGTVFKVTTSGLLTTLYSFTGGDDGAHPIGTLGLGSDGNFYGTAQGSSGSSFGNLFQITPAGVLTVIHSFTGYADGGSPLSGPIEGSDGNLYGTTELGGNYLLGTVYKVGPATPLPLAVNLTTSVATDAVNVPFTLSWKVLNAVSNTAQRCIASVQGNARSAGNWSGLQIGTASGATYSGSATITPTGSGVFTYGLTCGGSESGFVTVTVPPLSIVTTTLPDATVGTAYQQPLSATAGVPPYLWSIAGGTLPNGMSLNSTSGVISGTPTPPGAFSFTVLVSDSENPAAYATANLTLNVAAGTPIMLVTPSALTVRAGGTGTTMLTVAGFSTSSVTFACSGLPAHSQCTFSPAAGTPVTSLLQISTTGVVAASLAGRSLETALAFTFPGTILLLIGGNRRTLRGYKVSGMFLLLLASAILCGTSGCGGSAGTTTTRTPQPTPAGTSNITVTATAGSQSASTTLTLTVQ